MGLCVACTALGAEAIELAFHRLSPDLRAVDPATIVVKTNSVH
jgi:hypothetical protein